MNTNQTVMSKKDAIKLSEQFASELPLIELHILHTVSGALFNRDFNNRHKVLNFGGTLRGRFSSASVLHDIRFTMENEQNVHTKCLPELIKNALENNSVADEIRDKEYEILDTLFKHKQTTEQTLDIDEYTLLRYVEEIEAAAHQIMDNGMKLDSAAKAVVKNMTSSSTDRPLSDVTALFGRMSADQTFSTVYSPIMVSHAFTIDSYKNDYDDFTAIDDYLLKSGIVLMDDDGVSKNAGAAYMDTSDISANTYYRYGAISQRILFQNLCIGRTLYAVDDIKEKTYKLTADFAKRFIGALPSAMQTRKFARTAPDAVYIDKAPCIQGISAANVFESAVRATNNQSVCDIGVEKLKKFMDTSVNGCFVERKLTGQYWMSDKYSTPDGIPAVSYQDLDTIVRP